MSLLLDTNICIYALNERPAEVLQKFLEIGPDQMAISVITALELRYGAERSQNPDKAHSKLDLFLPPLKVLPFDLDSAESAAQIKAHLQNQGTPIGDFDCLIAAQAKSSQRTLVTNNLREFSRVPGLLTENWVVS